MSDVKPIHSVPSLVSGALRGRVSRRQFIERAIALGLSVPAATSLWSSAVEAATPRTGGTFRVGMNDANTTDSLDPGEASGAFTIQFNYVFRNFLTQITPTNRVGPDAAESWEPSPDAKLWRFKLAAGQEFQNGKPLTADDVVATMNYHRGPNSRSGAKALLTDIDDVKADGKNVVVITMKVGTADLPYMLTDYHLGILPSDGEGKADWASGIGAGPYELKSFRPGVQATFTKYANYHGKAYFDAVNMLGINDANARASGLVTDRLDAIATPDVKTLGLLQQRPGIAVDDVPSGTVISMEMDCRQAPFNNNNVRLAMKHAINREEIVKKIAFGHATIGNDNPIAPELPYYAKLPQYHYDPELAKSYMKKAGLDSIDVSLFCSEAVYPDAAGICELYSQSAATAGIKIKVIRVPSNNYWANIWRKRPFAMDNNGERPTPDMMFSTFYRVGAPWDPTYWDNPRFQKLLLLAKGELDQKKRAAMYREMQELCTDDGGVIVDFFSNVIDARRSSVMHEPHLTSTWTMDGGRAYQRWWFKS